MENTKITSYRNLPFYEKPEEDFYKFISFENLSQYDDGGRDTIIKCRTIGTLSSENGRYYLSSLTDSTSPKLPLSLCYLPDSPPSTLVPYPVQVLGTLQWNKRICLYVNIMQVLPAPLALRLNQSLIKTTVAHFVRDLSDN